MDRKHRRSCIYSTMNAETYYNFAPFVPPPLMPLRSSSTVLTTKSRFACFTLKQMSKPPSCAFHVPSGSLIGFAGQTRKYCMISLSQAHANICGGCTHSFPRIVHVCQVCSSAHIFQSKRHLLTEPHTLRETEMTVSHSRLVHIVNTNCTFARPPPEQPPCFRSSFE